jgi:hypothetical protein
LKPKNVTAFVTTPGYNWSVKTSFSLLFAFAMASAAAAQNLLPVQESGDIYADCGRVLNANGTSTIVSPFNYGFVNAPTNPMLSATFVNLSTGSNSAPSYNPDLMIGTETNQGKSSNSEMFLNFSSQVYGEVPEYSVAMQSFDFIPCIEVKLPKGTYTFQATATPFGSGTSTPGTFEFATLTQGVWTVQFNLALPKPEGATRTLTFAHDTKVRWMLISTPNQIADATITARYYNSGS